MESINYTDNNTNKEANNSSNNSSNSKEGNDNTRKADNKCNNNDNQPQQMMTTLNTKQQDIPGNVIVTAVASWKLRHDICMPHSCSNTKPFW